MEVHEQCVFGSTPGENCSSKKVLTGCEKLHPCVLSEKIVNDNRCRLIFEGCNGLKPGSFCEVKCKFPYRGEATKAMCPPGNIDPEYELIWTDPHCQVECD